MSVLANSETVLLSENTVEYFIKCYFYYKRYLYGGFIDLALTPVFISKAVVL